MPSDDKAIPLACILPFLEKLHLGGVDVTLIAGQAVNFWANYYKGTNQSLLQFLPFVSKDVDLLGEPKELSRISDFLKGEIVRYSEVRTTMIGTFTSSDDPPVRFELLRTFFGSLSTKRVVDRRRLLENVRVIDPISLLAAKCHNLSGIDQEGRQDGRHVRMMVLVSRAYFLDILGELGKAVTERQFINEVRYLIDLHDHRGMQSGLTSAGHTLADCLPIREITAAGENFPKISRFTENALVQLGD